MWTIINSCQHSVPLAFLSFSIFYMHTSLHTLLYNTPSFNSPTRHPTTPHLIPPTAELARKPLAMTESEACALLQITPNTDGIVTEDTLKSAYRQLARKYHPDKNPAGRDTFMAIQKAYERLQAGAAGGQGPQTWRILLLLKVRGGLGGVLV